jgi:hypothetical protein
MSGNQESELAAALVTREWAADSVATTPRTARGVGHPLFGFINKKQEEGSSYFGKDGPGAPPLPILIQPLDLESLGAPLLRDFRKGGRGTSRTSKRF